MTILRQAGYSFEQVKNVRIVESDTDNLVNIIAKHSDSNGIITFKNPQGVICTAVEISKIGYELVKHVWISPDTKAHDIMNVVDSLPEGEAVKAERNRVTDILSKKFRITKRGG